MRCTGLSTGSSRQILVHTCKYRKIRAMCCLPDIRRQTETQQLYGSSRNKGFSIPYINQLCQSLERKHIASFRLFKSWKARDDIGRVKQCVAIMRTSLFFSTEIMAQGMTFRVPGTSANCRGVVSRVLYDAAPRLSSPAYIIFLQQCADILRAMSPPAQGIGGRGQDFNIAASNGRRHASISYWR